MPAPRSSSLVITSAIVAATIGAAALLFADPLPIITPRQSSKPDSSRNTIPSAAPTQPARPNSATLESVTPEKVTHETWQVLSMGGQRIGSVRTLESPEPAAPGDPPLLHVSQEMRLNLKRFGQELELVAKVETVETADGDLRSFRFELSNSPSGVIRTIGHAEGSQLKVETAIDGRTRSQSVPFRAGTKSPAYQERFLREQGLKSGQTVSFPVYFPDRNEIAEVRMSGGDVREVKLPDGSRQELQKISITEGGSTPTSSTAYAKPGGNVVLVESSMFGQQFQTLTVTKEEALQQIAGAELDFAVSMLIPVSPLNQPGKTKRVVYRITVPGQDAAALFSQGDTQSVQAVDRDTADVTVRSIPVPTGRTKEPVDDEYLNANQLIQSDDATVRELALRAASPDRSPGETAVAMEKYVHEKLAAKNFSTAFASAAETARRLEGDCTEHSVLLAAMLRSRGIPARVAAGLVYLQGQNRMGGHMWTEAYLDGKWVPLDATLGAGVVGADRLKVADSSLQDSGPLPVMAFAPLMNLTPQTQILVEDVQY